MESKTEKNQANEKPFHIMTVVWTILLLLYILAIVSYNKGDLAILEGGVDGIGLEKNWIGNTGAHISRMAFYLFGLAVYPVGLLFIFSVIRRFIPIPLKRPGHAGALLSVFLGTVLLFAMYPANWIEETENRGIGRAMQPELCLSGGVVGAVLSAPAVNERDCHIDAGFLRRHIGETGTFIVGLALLISGLVFLFLQDWLPVILYWIRAERESKRQKVREPEPPQTVISDNSEPIQKEEETNSDKSLTEGSSNKKMIDGLLEKVRNFWSPAQPEEESGEDAEAEGEAPAGDEKNNDPDDSYVVAPPPPSEADDNMNPSVMPQVALSDDHHANVVAPPPPPADVDADGEVISANEPEIICPPVQPPQSNVGVKQFAEQKPKFDTEKPQVQADDDVSHGGTGGISCPNYELPSIYLLDKQVEVKNEDSAHIEESRERIQQTLESFNVEGHVSEIVVGPRVTRFEVSLAPGIKVEKVTGIQSNIAMDLAAKSIRILAPIPGKTTVGIEVPNKVSSTVYIRGLMESAVWRESHASIPIILGRDIAGKVMVTDLAKAPHLLIAGSTGSGKSVCMNTLIMSLLFRFSPAELRLIMVDPKVVELEMYRPIPHLITPVVNDPKKVPLALRWGVNEMERRYRVLAKVKAKNLAAFNSRPKENAPVLDDDGNVIPPKLPLVIIIIDELADIMMTDAKADVETSICRIAQKGRAAGMHLVIATQSPRKDVVTGLIKTNLPTKIAFKVSSNMDSRVILDIGGAEKLLGYGDMLFKPNGADGMERIQGSLVSDPEIQKVVDFISGQVPQHFDSQVLAEDVEVHNGEENDDDFSQERRGHAKVYRHNEYDPTDVDVDDVIDDILQENSAAAKYLRPGDPPLLQKALEIIINEQKASTSYLQRRLGIGYNKSAELMDQLEQRGIISAPLPGGQKREILITDGLEVSKQPGE